MSQWKLLCHIWMKKKTHTQAHLFMSMSLPFPLSIYASTKVTACEMRFNVCYNVGRCVNYTQNGECKQYHRVCVCIRASFFFPFFCCCFFCTMQAQMYRSRASSDTIYGYILLNKIWNYAKLKITITHTYVNVLLCFFLSFFFPLFRSMHACIHVYDVMWYAKNNDEQ